MAALLNKLFHPGMRVELLASNNKLMFRGVVDKYDGDVLQVSEVSGQSVPPMIYNTEVKVSGAAPGGDAFVLHGYISGCSEYVWRIEKLDVMSSQENRAFFRQLVSGSAIAERVSRLQPSEEAEEGPKGPVPCRIVDVSANGVQIGCAKKFQVGDRLSLKKMSITPGGEEFNVVCRVRRVQEKQGEALMGCELEGLDDKTQERLLQAIFTIQRRELQARRGGIRY